MRGAGSLALAMVGAGVAQAASAPTGTSVVMPLFNPKLVNLSAPCQRAVAELEMRLMSNETSAQAFAEVTEAVFASGRMLEGLYILNAALSAPPPPNQDQKAGVLALVEGYPWVSLGNPDSCAYIPNHHYCQFNLAGVYIRYGVCVPAACDAADVATALNQTYHALTQAVHKGAGGAWLSPAINLNQASMCGDKEFPYTTGTYVMITLTLVLLTLVAAATAVDWLRHAKVAREKRRAEEEAGDDAALGMVRESRSRSWYECDGLGMRLVLCFSLVKNWQLLMAGNRGGPFDSLDGIRTLSMTWVIFGHTFIFALMGTNYSNLNKILGMDGQGLLATYSAQAITGGYFAVDTFFFLSAFLAVYLMLEQLNKGPDSALAKLSFIGQAPKIYLLRFIRLTPAYFYVVLMYWKVLSTADKGPFWGLLTSNDYKVCSDSWWTNLLYVNNLVTETSEIGQEGLSCYAVSWYLAVDFQLFLLTPLVAAVAAWNHLVALALMGLGTLVTIGYAWVQSYREHWTIDLLEQGPYFLDYYIKPWTRAPPYLMGMGLAIVWFYYFRSSSQSNPTPLAARVRSSRMLVAALELFALFLFAITVWGGIGAYEDTPPEWSEDTMAAYIALSKPAWTLGLVLMCFLLFLGEGGPIKALLECRPFTVWSRLTYCMYLVHPAVIYWMYNSVLGPIHYSSIWYMLTFLGALTTVTIFSTGVHLLVERPVANLERLLLRGGGKDRKKKGGDYNKATLSLEEGRDAPANGNGHADLTEPLLERPNGRT